MHIHILGICGTFMGSIAQLAAELGHTVTGSDQNVYPPMSTQLTQAGITLIEGYDPKQLEPAPDLVIIGNALSRANPAVEAVLNKGIPYTSGPEWLRLHVLPGKWVLAVAGTHGKTTTSSILAWILEYAGMEPGFLIGGVTQNFPHSARLGKTPFFVIEADEYDSAFFDKRSKFIHYQPRTLILNNLEYDHADIFPDLAAIQKQFHHLIRTVPSDGQIIYPNADTALQEVLAEGLWSQTQTIGTELNDKTKTVQAPKWHTENITPDGKHFALFQNGKHITEVNWNMCGQHNVSNALAAIVAARHVGVTPEICTKALGEFKGIKRRLECIANVHSIQVYDDFAHHPTAIKTTLDGLRAQVGSDKIIAIIEPRSNTMRLGTHKHTLAPACSSANCALWYQPNNTSWNLQNVIEHSSVPAKLFHDINTLIDAALTLCEARTHIVIMSNGGFEGIHEKLVNQLNQHAF